MQDLLGVRFEGEDNAAALLTGLFSSLAQQIPARWILKVPMVSRTCILGDLPGPDDIHESTSLLSISLSVASARAVL
jgi:hypothetical protein